MIPASNRRFQLINNSEPMTECLTRQLCTNRDFLCAEALEVNCVGSWLV